MSLLKYLQLNFDHMLAFMEPYQQNKSPISVKIIQEAWTKFRSDWLSIDFGDTASRNQLLFESGLLFTNRVKFEHEKTKSLRITSHTKEHIFETAGDPTHAVIASNGYATHPQDAGSATIEAIMGISKQKGYSYWLPGHFRDHAGNFVDMSDFGYKNADYFACALKYIVDSGTKFITIITGSLAAMATIKALSSIVDEKVKAAIKAIVLVNHPINYEHQSNLFKACTHLAKHGFTVPLLQSQFPKVNMSRPIDIDLQFMEMTASDLASIHASKIPVLYIRNTPDPFINSEYTKSAWVLAKPVEGSHVHYAVIPHKNHSIYSLFLYPEGIDALIAIQNIGLAPDRVAAEAVMKEFSGR